MNFLRSIIADARPRKLSRDPLGALSPKNGLINHASDRNGFGVEGVSSGSLNDKNGLSKSLFNREDAGDGNSVDVHKSQVVNPPTQRLENNIESGMELESPPSATVDSLELKSPLLTSVDSFSPIHNDANTISHDSVNFPEQQFDSVEEQTPYVEESMIQQSAGTDNSDSSETTRMSQGDNPSIANLPEASNGQNLAADYEGTESVRPSAKVKNSFSPAEGADIIETADQPSPAGPLEGKETPLIQARTTQTAAVSLPVAARPNVSGGLEVPLASSGDSPATISNQPANISVEGAGAEQSLADVRIADQVSAKVEKQPETMTLSNQQESPRLTRQAEAKEVSISTGSLPSETPKPDRPPQQTDKIAGLSTTAQPIESVSARPSQAELLPKVGDSGHSRAPLRLPSQETAGPKVQIGQIDVIIGTTAQPNSKPAPAASQIDLASRHYLRRL